MTSRSPVRAWAWWTLGFLAFPPAGLIGRALAGPVDDPGAALLGGAVTGLVIGVGQVIAGRGRLPALRWPVTTAIGTGCGLLLGAVVVGYGTTLADLAVMGALTGAVLGPAQALTLPRTVPHRWAWAVTVPPLWALGWTVTTLAGVDVDAAYTVFGATGALAFSALSGLLFLRLTGRTSAVGASAVSRRGARR
ncbi:hypothetical protein GCM10023328_42970 [Modestobacter marinus]|uniref:Uncharacterized protein n=1 Tax=Modestobacter marinus TaxID=477641 RepID=A0A846LK06_9ACTN|nr:hypothetical protein [Modestobacter marinus]NIH68403.1 hypothetical protein [Modestobacter marinus]GGL56932.1 hypothetical protein GCM10011589_11220 [Modestobacter marinus]